MKKLLSCVLTLALVLTMFPVYAQATENEHSDEVISFEEYYNSMKALFAEYNIDYVILDADESTIYTRELLNTQLSETREKLEETAVHTSISFIANENTSKECSTGENIVRALMPYDYSETYDVYITSPSSVGSAWFTMTLNAIADAQYGTFMNVKSYTFKQNGGYVNFKSWTEISKGYSYSSDRKDCTVTFVGELVVEYTEPITGITAGYSSTHEVAHTFSV